MICNTALKTLVTLFVLCTEAAAQTTCDVRWPEMRDRLDAADSLTYGLIVAALQSAPDHNGERDTTTEVFCEWGRGLTKPPQ